MPLCRCRGVWAPVQGLRWAAALYFSCFRVPPAFGLWVAWRREAEGGRDYCAHETSVLRPEGPEDDTLDEVLKKPNE